MAKVETTIPFSGFYETIHQDAIERRYNVDDDSYSIRDEENEEWQKRWDEYCKNCKEDQKEYCATYVKYFSKIVGIPLKFKEMTSPREYNFTTDRIFADIDEADVERLKELVDIGGMREYVAKHFTSRDGFSSFYDSNYDNWLKQEEPFDHNQIGALLECYAWQVDDNWEEKVYEDTQGNF